MNELELPYTIYGNVKCTLKQKKIFWNVKLH